MGATAVVAVVLAASIETVRLKRLSDGYRRSASFHAGAEGLTKSYEQQILAMALEWEAKDPALIVAAASRMRGKMLDEPLPAEDIEMLVRHVEKQLKERAEELRQKAAKSVAAANHHTTWKQTYDYAASHPWVMVPEEPPEPHW